ncbi:MAG: hypothetical protein Q9165_003629 [Trypethelium subeluteriae]
MQRRSRCSKELLDAIESLKADGEATKWKSFRQALKSVWMEKDIQDLSRRLERYRQQIDSTLLMHLQETLHRVTVDVQHQDGTIDQNSSAMRQSLQSGSKWQTALVDSARQSLTNQEIQDPKQLNKLVADKGRMFFFLIDGLDEFYGDCKDLDDFLLSNLSSEGNVKLCVASRPWLVFEDAFQRRPSLRMEALIRKDINLSASEKLHEGVMFTHLQKLDPKNASQLIEDVTEKASSVLWKILGDLDLSYFQQATRILGTVRASHVPWKEISMENKELLEFKDSEELKQNRDNLSPLALLSLSFM